VRLPRHQRQLLLQRLEEFKDCESPLEKEEFLDRFLKDVKVEDVETFSEIDAELQGLTFKEQVEYLKGRLEEVSEKTVILRTELKRQGKDFNVRITKLEKGIIELKKDNIELKKDNIELKKDNIELKKDNKEMTVKVDKWDKERNENLAALLAGDLIFKLQDLYKVNNVEEVVKALKTPLENKAQFIKMAIELKDERIGLGHPGTTKRYKKMSWDELLALVTQYYPDDDLRKWLVDNFSLLKELLNSETPF